MQAEVLVQQIADEEVDVPFKKLGRPVVRSMTVPRQPLQLAAKDPAGHVFAAVADGVGTPRRLGGQVTTAEVIKASLDVKSVQECVKGHVREITFPTLPKQYETSYTYAMEAN